jgi:hypothetical protein
MTDVHQDIFSWCASRIGVLHQPSMLTRRYLSDDPIPEMRSIVTYSSSIVPNSGLHVSEII